MPFVYRPMVHEGSKPMIGSFDNMLGVRTSGPRADVFLNSDNKVGPGHGMSVSSDWTKLPPLLIPFRYREQAPRARGSDNLTIFRLDDHDLENGPNDDHLTLAWDKRAHGLIEPSREMLIDDYQNALAATRDRWNVVAIQEDRQ